jgi:hypothetical protein
MRSDSFVNPEVCIENDGKGEPRSDEEGNDDLAELEVNLELSTSTLRQCQPMLIGQSRGANVRNRIGIRTDDVGIALEQAWRGRAIELVAALLKLRAVQRVAFCHSCARQRLSSSNGASFERHRQRRAAGNVVDKLYSMAAAEDTHLEIASWSQRYQDSKRH